MEPLPYTNLSKGTLLIASPETDSGIYFRAVVLVCEHGPTGSFGLIINKPIDIDLPEDLINLKESLNPHVRVQAGGPLQSNQMMLLHSSTSNPEETMEICPGVHLGGDLEFLQEMMSQESGPSIRLCFGYAGWGPGQLEQEFLGGLWFLHPASSRLVFDLPLEKEWQTILREMGGKYAILSMIPEDLSLN